MSLVKTYCFCDRMKLVSVGGSPTGAALRVAIDSSDATAIEAALKAGNAAGADAALLREGVLKLASLTSSSKLAVPSRPLTKAVVPTTAAPPPAAAPPRAGEPAERSTAPTSVSAQASSPHSWVPGLLELPPSETRRVQLSVRAKWPHMVTRLADRATIASTVRSAVADIIGHADEVLTGMVLRHLEMFAMPREELRPHELAHLLAILIGAERATRLVKAVIAVLEEGLQESWYEKQMRRKYGAG